MIAQISTQMSTPTLEVVPTPKSSEFNESLVIETFQELREELTNLAMQYLKVLRRTGEKFYNALNGEDDTSYIKSYKAIAKEYSAFKKIAEQARILYRETADEERFEQASHLIETTAFTNGFNTAIAVNKKLHLIPPDKIKYLQDIVDSEEPIIKAKDIALASKPPEWMETHRVEWVDKSDCSDTTGRRPLAKGYIVGVEEEDGIFSLQVKLDNKDEIATVEGRKLKILPEPKTSEFVVILERGDYCNKQGILFGYEYDENEQKNARIALIDSPDPLVSIPHKMVEKIKLPDSIIDKVLTPAQLEGSEIISELKEENAQLIEKIKTIEESSEQVNELVQAKEEAIAKIAELEENYKKAEEIVVELETENLTLKEKLSAEPKIEESKTYCPEFKAVASLDDCQKNDYVIIAGKDGSQRSATIKDISSGYVELEVPCKIETGKFVVREESLHISQIKSGELTLRKMIGQAEFDSKVSRLQKEITQLKEELKVKEAAQPKSEKDIPISKVGTIDQETVDLQFKVKELEDLLERREEAVQQITSLENQLISVRKVHTLLSEKVLSKTDFYQPEMEVLVLHSPKQPQFENKKGVIEKVSGGTAIVKVSGYPLSVDFTLSSLIPA